MTAIGFLGAGAILKERLTILGLTTAGSIWMTAAIGIVVGVGLYLIATVALVLSLFVLTVLRFTEDRIPTLQFGVLRVRFVDGASLSEADLTEVIDSYRISSSDPGYRFEAGEIEYEMSIRMNQGTNFRELRRRSAVWSR